MVSAYLFDQRQSERVEDWAGALHGLNKNQLLWIDLVDASEDETVDVLDALDLGAAAELKLGDPERRPCVDEFERHLRVTAVAVSDTERDAARERVVVDCFRDSDGRHPQVPLELVDTSVTAVRIAELQLRGSAQVKRVEDIDCLVLGGIHQVDQRS